MHVVKRRWGLWLGLLLLAFAPWHLLDAADTPAESDAADIPAESTEPGPGEVATDPATVTPPAAGTAPKTGYALIRGDIDRHRARYLERAIEDAREQQLDVLVIEIDTDGGLVFYAREMLKQALDQSKDGPKLVAYVGFRAISAGAMIAYGHDEIYISSTASIGDIGVIMQSPDGGIEYAPEKMETVVRSLLRLCHEKRGWPEGPLLKMTARNKKLYRVSKEDGSRDYVIEDDWEEYQANNPDIDIYDKEQVIVAYGEDRLLTMTGQEALEMGMATGIAESLDEVYTKLGIDAKAVIDLSPSSSEQTAWWLDGFAGLFMGLAVLFIFAELKTPGVGIWAILAATSFCLFLFTTYSLDILNNIELAIMIVGLILIVVELFTAWSGGIVGIAGGLVFIIGLFMALIPNEMPFDFSDEQFSDAFSSALGQSLMAMCVIGVGLVLFITLLPRLGIVNRLAVQAEIAGSSAGAIEEQAAKQVGQRGIASSDLRPGGTITLAGEDFSAHAENGAFIDEGTAVEVVSAQFGEIIVRAAKADDNAEPT